VLSDSGLSGLRRLVSQWFLSGLPGLSVVSQWSQWSPSGLSGLSVLSDSGLSGLPVVSQWSQTVGLSVMEDSYPATSIDSLQPHTEISAESELPRRSDVKVYKEFCDFYVRS